jgi:hypothetical protein
MKTLFHAACATAILAAPIATFAQSNAPLTHAQVADEIVQLEKAGFNPANANTENFPTNFQASTAGGQDSGYGPAGTGSSQAGRSASVPGLKPVFFGQ